MVIFDIRIFGRFLYEYLNILLRPYCLKMMDKVRTGKCTTKTENGYCNKVCDICIHQKMCKIVANK